MKLPTEIFGDVMVIHTPEEISGDRAEELESFLVTQQSQNLVVDLDSTEALDSRTLETFLNAQETLRQKGGNLKVSTHNFVNKKILEITRLDQHLEVFDSVIDAVKSYV
ncbi:MAG: STAS domain-containing protein [Pirellulaceae bacterium]|nr:STAS domain-containing protein [Pirellulaceae bacterium]